MKTKKNQKSMSSTSDQLKYKLILVGDSCVGKSALLMRFSFDRFHDSSTDPTIIDFRPKDVYLPQTKQSIKLFIWDTAGQQRFKSIVSTYFKGCHGVILVFDLSQPKTFQSAKNQWFNLIKRKAQSATIILVGNKCDLESKVDHQQIQKFIRQNKITYIETSVKNNINVQETFMKLTRMIHSKKQEFDKPKSFYLKQKQSVSRRRKRDCCKNI